MNGIRNIYYDGDIEVLMEAAYGPCIESRYPDFGDKPNLKLSMFDDNLSVRFPNNGQELPAIIKVGADDSDAPYFAIVSEYDSIPLVQLKLTEPAYYPDEEGCRYILDMRGLSVLNRYLREHFDQLIEEWNKLHPSHTLSLGLPLPNYRFLASEAYAQERKRKKRD